MRDTPDWVLVAGGTCHFGDRSRPVMVRTLLWTRTPITWIQAGLSTTGSTANEPATGLNYLEATNIAARHNARLPRSSEWEWAAGGASRRLFPWGNDEWTPEHANLRPNGLGRVSVVGSHPSGRTPEGLIDMAGNVWEWCSSPVWGGGYVIRGGSYASPVLYGRTRFLNAAPMERRSPGIGLRLVRELS